MMHEILNLSAVDNPAFRPLGDAYLKLLKHWNSAIKLVAGANVDNLLIELFNSSVAPLKNLEIPSGAKLLDVGSGAGFPGIPLKLARQDLQLTLLEPRRKKRLFLQRVISELKLTDVRALGGRLEDFAALANERAAYDLITTRGAGSSLKLFPHLRALLQAQGSIWFYKSPTVRREARQLSDAFSCSLEIVHLQENLDLWVSEGGKDK